MRYNAWATVLIGLSALCLTACSVSRQALRSEAAKVDFPLRAVELNLHDERLTVQRDTIYVEKRDSSLRLSSLGAYGLQEDGTPTVSGKLSAVSKVLKRITTLICAVVVLIITVKVCTLRR